MAGVFWRNWLTRTYGNWTRLLPTCVKWWDELIATAGATCLLSKSLGTCTIFLLMGAGMLDDLFGGSEPARVFRFPGTDAGDRHVLDFAGASILVSWVRTHFHAPSFHTSTSVWRSMMSKGLPPNTPE